MYSAWIDGHGTRDNGGACVIGWVEMGRKGMDSDGAASPTPAARMVYWMEEMSRCCMDSSKKVSLRQGRGRNICPRRAWLDIARKKQRREKGTDMQS